MNQIFIRFSRRAGPHDSVDELHQRLSHFLQSMPPLWALPPLPRPSFDGDNISSHHEVKFLQVDAFLQVSYIYRKVGWTKDDHGHDDRVIVTLDAAELYEPFVRDIFIPLSLGYGAYAAEAVADRALSREDWDRITSRPDSHQLNFRKFQHRYHPVAVYDSRFCIEAFGIPPRGVAARLSEFCDGISVMDNHLIIMAAPQIPDRAFILDHDRKVKAALGLPDPFELDNYPSP